MYRAYNFIHLEEYDKYEISTDEIENHRMIKSDIPDIWIDGEIITRDLENGKSYFLIVKISREWHRRFT